MREVDMRYMYQSQEYNRDAISVIGRMSKDSAVRILERI